MKIIVLMTLFGLFLMSCSVLPRDGSIRGKEISPYDYGLTRAKTDVERFYVLEKTHQAALASNVRVSYKGITTIDIEIPDGAKSIPIDKGVDFHGVRINIRNNTGDFYLFSAIAPRKGIKVSGASIDSGNFKGYAQLIKGSALLVIEDENPWGDERQGYYYAHKRRDILLIRQGISVNQPIMPYNNLYSSPKCSYITIQEQKPLVIRNLEINRKADCSFKTFLLLIDGYNDVRIENIIVNTSAVAGLVSDHLLRIQNCTRVLIKDTKIDGTYSAEKQAGYGIYLNNVWDFHAVNLYGRGKWGVFGTNNVNNARLDNCDINRFDIHCYGRDCTFKKVNFVELGNQFSSVFGTIIFDECVFSDFTPLINRSSYNALVGYDIYLNNCVYNVTPKNNVLLNMGMLDDRKNSRPELEKKCWPNIHINNLIVNMTGGARDFVVLTNYKGSDSSGFPAVDHINTIRIVGLDIYTEAGVPLNNVKICTTNIPTVKKIDCIISDVNVYEKSINGVVVKHSPNKTRLSVGLPLKDNRAKLKRVNGLVAD